MILLGLGANLPSQHGDAPATLRLAVKTLENQNIAILQRSRFWITAPIPFSEQPWYHNAVVEIRTALPPDELLTLLHQIENDFGRVRHTCNEARIIDLDLIAYNDFIIETSSLNLPHPRMHERGFVLHPLADIAPDWIHPRNKLTTRDMIRKLGSEQTAYPSEAVL